MRMSKFIELMEKAGRQTNSPMGFAQAKDQSDVAPQLVLVAGVLPEDLQKRPGLAETNADAFLVGGLLEDSKLDSSTKSLSGRLWGARLPQFSASDVKGLMKMGCDYIVLESMDTEAAVLNEEDLGTVVALGGDLGDETIRSICELPVDAVLFSPAQRTQPMTIGHLASIQRVRGLTDKPLLVEAPLGLGQPDLEALRNLGISALIVDVPPANKITKVKAAIEGLPQPMPRRQSRDAQLPHLASAPEASRPIPEDDDEDEDF